MEVRDILIIECRGYINNGGYEISNSRGYWIAENKGYEKSNNGGCRISKQWRVRDI